MTKQESKPVDKSCTDEDLFAGPRYPVALMVRDALEMPETFDVLLRHFKAYVQVLSTAKAFYFPEDAQQAAWIRVWRKMHRADLLRPESVEPYLKAVILSAVRDEVRKQLRGTRYLWDAKDPGLLPEKSLYRTYIELEHELDPLLKQYLNHIRRTGDWNDAHKNIGIQRGVSTARATTLFHRAARDLIDKEAKKSEKELSHHFGRKMPRRPQSPGADG